jgi:UDP-GlcNAc:undecaprenyl-phosphate GlcNAc-1-phosphate transferase
MSMSLPLWAALPIFVAWSVLIINAFNLIDGLDGLCAGLVLISLSMILILALSAGNWRDSVFVILMIGAVGGFLIFNFNPARIFLGDAGSMMLGFFIASMANSMAGERALIGSLVLPIAVAGVPNPPESKLSSVVPFRVRAQISNLKVQT